MLKLVAPRGAPRKGDHRARGRVTLVHSPARIIELSLFDKRRLPAKPRVEALRPVTRTAWIVNQYAVTPEMPGGTRHIELAELLRLHGWQGVVFATPFNHSLGASLRDISPRRPVLTEDVDGVVFRWLYSTPYRGNSSRRYLNMVSFMVAVVLAGVRQPRPDIVIGSSPHLLAACGAWILARWHRRPFVLEVRDIWPDALVELGLRSPLVISPLRLIERFLYARARRIVALTEGIERQIVAKGVPSNKLVLIPNAALKPRPIDGARRRARRAALGWDGKVVAVWVGAHGVANGLDLVVEAGRRLADDRRVMLVLVGDGPEKPRLRELAADLPNVVFCDPLPKREVGELLGAADIGIMVNRPTEQSTGQRPNKLFDYMAAALPIVSNLPGECRRLVDEAGVGVSVPPEDAASLAEAIRRLADDPAGRAEMGRRGFQHVAQAHSREDTAVVLAATLDAAVAAGSGRRWSGFGRLFRRHDRLGREPLGSVADRANK
jgi:glycosyltransferase involved in cell wall biosynthesis